MERETARNVERAFRNQDYPTTHPRYPQPGQGIVFLGLGWVPSSSFGLINLNKEREADRLTASNKHVWDQP